jgi:hypothetical protein
VVTNPWLRSFIDLECFVLSGMLARDTIAAEMAFMFMERNSGRSSIDYPLGGSKAIVDALIRGGWNAIFLCREGADRVLRCTSGVFKFLLSLLLVLRCLNTVVFIYHVVQELRRMADVYCCGAMWRRC